MTVPAIIPFQTLGTPESVAIPPDRVVTGHPSTTVDNRYSSSDAKFHAGLWTSTVGCWQVRYTEHEYCVLTRGRVRLTSTDGVVLEFKAGDAFVIPAGFCGTWATLEDCAKHYVIYESA
jgi:uncharacterized protein